MLICIKSSWFGTCFLARVFYTCPNLNDLRVPLYCLHYAIAMFLGAGYIGRFNSNPKSMSIEREQWGRAGGR